MFPDFVPVERIAGKAIASAIISHLIAWVLSLVDFCGQCYDGSSNMAGASFGCTSIIQQQASMAIYGHYAAHQLNLAVVAAYKTQAFNSQQNDSTYYM